MNHRSAHDLSQDQINELLKQGTAPKVTPELLESLIVKEEYHRWPDSMLITCKLTLKNGFDVTGESACASPENFKEETGRAIARRNARDKMWSLEGYVLRNKLQLIEEAQQSSMAGPEVKTYVGTKVVHAMPMNRADYNTMRGWTLPADEDGTDEGYLVEYADGGKPNVEGYAGYVSWSPRDVFERAYGAGTVIKQTTFLERLVEELEQLTDRIGKLSLFVGSSKFQELEATQKVLLGDQLTYMRGYQSKLQHRLEDLGAR